LQPGKKLAGRTLPVRHYGSVDVFLEALGEGKQGDVLVIDNGGRTDEGCVGDLIAMEVKDSGVAGIAIWGVHRDTTDLLIVDLPLFSYGACPAGPLRVDAREPEALESARFGDRLVTREDVVFADDDGMLFVSSQDVETILSRATEIRNIERKQADLLQSGSNLRAQLEFEAYLRKRSADSSYTFRDHLREIGGAIEE
jgi:regulator of RNase E activity RraA